MRPHPFFTLAVIAIVPSIRAQTALYAQHNGTYTLVRSAIGSIAQVEENGKLVTESHGPYAFAKVDEYAPYFVAVRDLQVNYRNTIVDAGSSGSAQSSGFRLSAEIESPYPLKRVFLALELDAEEGKAIFVRDLGQLEPGQSRTVALMAPVRKSLGPGSYRLHIFTDGREVFHSKMAPDYIEETLDRMVANRVKN